MGRTSISGGADANFNWGDMTALDGVTQGLWSLWVNVIAWDSASQTVWSKDDSPTNNAGWNYQRQSSNDIMTFTRRGSGGSDTTAIAGPFAGQGWVQIGGYVDLNELFPVRTYRNGAEVNQDTTVRNVFGNNANNVNCNVSSNIALAEMAMWRNLSVTDAANIMAMVAAGFHPLQMPITPFAFAPLYGRGSVEIDYRGTLASATMGANSTFSNHPKVKRRPGLQL